MESELLSLVNSARASSGLRPVTINPRLTAAAQTHSLDQARRNRMGHEGSNGSSIGQRVKQQGYSMRYAGENVAAGQTSARAVFRDWMNSAGHR
jgi:uncharacterized protein YkwD